MGSVRAKLAFKCVLACDFNLHRRILFVKKKLFIGWKANLKNSDCGHRPPSDLQQKSFFVKGEKKSFSCQSRKSFVSTLTLTLMDVFYFFSTNDQLTMCFFCCGSIIHKRRQFHHYRTSFGFYFMPFLATWQNENLSLRFCCFYQKNFFYKRTSERMKNTFRILERAEYKKNSASCP